MERKFVIDCSEVAKRKAEIACVGKKKFNIAQERKKRSKTLEKALPLFFWSSLS